MADLLVELLAVEDCPHLEQARRDLESVLGGGILETPIQLILVGSAEVKENALPKGPCTRIEFARGRDAAPFGSADNAGRGAHLAARGPAK